VLLTDGREPIIVWRDASNVDIELPCGIVFHFSNSFYAGENGEPGHMVRVKLDEKGGSLRCD
jgi:hypothetical protein